VVFVVFHQNIVNLDHHLKSANHGYWSIIQIFTQIWNEEGNEDENKEAKSSGKRGGKGLVKPETTDNEVKLLPGGKVKKKEKPTIHISRVQRNKRKYVTIIVGLEKFGVKLPEAAKLFAKKFSCGSSVVKSPGGEDEIDVQGDFTDDIVDFVMEKWDVPEDSIICDDGKHKGPNKKRVQPKVDTE